MQGDGVNTSFGETELTSEAPVPQVTKPEATPIPEVKQQPTPQVTNQYDKLRTGAVIVLLIDVLTMGKKVISPKVFTFFDSIAKKINPIRVLFFKLF